MLLGNCSGWPWLEGNGVHGLGRLRSGGRNVGAGVNGRGDAYIFEMLNCARGATAPCTQDLCFLS